MRFSRWMTVGSAVVVATVTIAAAQRGGQQPRRRRPRRIRRRCWSIDSNLDRYKATIKGLTQFGDRREGTQRNRDAVAWIEAQLKSYGCPTERMTYEVAARGGGAGGGNAAVARRVPLEPPELEPPELARPGRCAVPAEQDELARRPRAGAALAQEPPPQVQARLLAEAGRDAERRPSLTQPNRSSGTQNGGSTSTASRGRPA